MERRRCATECYPSKIIGEGEGLELPEYGIFPIGSKRDFNTKNKVWGNEVALIETALKALQIQPKVRQPYQPERLRRLRAEAALSLAEEKLSNVTGNWHIERERAQIAEVRQSQSDKKLEAALADKSSLMAENAELLRLLSTDQKKLHVVR